MKVRLPLLSSLDQGTSLGLVLAIGAVVGWRWYDSSQAEQLEVSSSLYESFVSAEGDARLALGDHRKAATTKSAAKPAKAAASPARSR